LQDFWITNEIFLKQIIAVMKNYTHFIFLLLLSIPVINSQSQIMFTDAAPSMGVNDPGAAQGCVFLDVNNDGWLDIFLINNNTINKLWINSGGTAFTDAAAVWGVSIPSPGRGVSAGDFDNDGNIDMMVGNFNANLVLYKNTGSSFINYTSAAGINFPCWGGSINWLDYNNDGKLDAILGNDGVPYHYNYLFRNDNLLSFTNVAYTAGIVDSTSTLTITSADYDNDGDLDIFCGTQTGYGPHTSFLYKNNGNGTFTDVTQSSGITVMSYSWSADWGDFDNDGDMDLYAGNSNGPNNLYVNNGNGTFTEAAATYGVADPFSSFSCGWADFDNDGDLDLYVANGQPNADKLYRNDGSTFTDVAAAVGTNDTRHSSCISWGDFDNNGFMDVYLNNNGTENRLYKNNAGNSNKWVILKLQGTTSNRSAIGARVKVKAGSLNMIREVSGGSGGKGQNSLPVEFGLGSASTIDSIIVRWPSGLVQGFANVTPNVIFSLTEGQGLVGAIITWDPTLPGVFALYQNYPNPFNPSTTIRFDNIIRQNIKISVYDISGRLVEHIVNSQFGRGTFSVRFDGTNLPSGVYFYKITAGSYSETKKMILIK
jgi:enediyne biosynthesis protein E4